MRLGKALADHNLVRAQRFGHPADPHVKLIERGPVDLAIEILSPSERPFLQKRKFTDYERYGKIVRQFNISAQ